MMKTKNVIVSAGIALLCISLLWNFASCRMDSVYLEKIEEQIEKDLNAEKTSSGYSLIYDGNGHTAGLVPVDENRYLEGSSATVLGNSNGLLKNAYSFNNWNTAADGSANVYVKGDTIVMEASDLVLYAQWKAKQSYRVSYDGNGNDSGAAPVDGVEYLEGDTVNVKNQGTLSLSTATFISWNTAADGSGTSYLVDSSFPMPAENLVLYAQWTTNPTYTVSYDGNGSDGGNIPSDENNYQEGTMVNVFGAGSGASEMTKTGYSFSGWNTVENGSGIPRPAGSSFLMASENVTLYAQWDVNNYSVSFDENSGTTPVPSSKSVIFDTAYGTLPTVSRTGYAFLGWYTQLTGGTEITAVSILSIGNDHTLYAQWSGNIYTITFEEQGGSAPSPATKEVIFGSEYGTLPAVSRNGYAFNGWYTASSGGTKIESSTSVAITGNHTLYAQWSANTYTLTFNSNGGLTPSPASKSVIFGSVYETLATTSRTGYSFEGWFTASSGGSEITATDTVTIPGNHTLYAHWSANSYNLIFDSQGGSSAIPSNKTVDYGSAYGPLATSSRPGYTLNGWYTASSGGTKITAATTVLTPGNHTLYAQWGANTYTVTFNAAGGTNPSPSSKTVIYGSSYGTLATTARTYYLFDGWWTAEGGNGTEITASSIVNSPGNLTLYAKWIYGGTGPGGGLVFYDKGSYTEGWRYLEAAPPSTEWGGQYWGGRGYSVGGTSKNIGTGDSNTNAIYAEYGDAEPEFGYTDYAAKICYNLISGGKSDWFLPSFDELELMYLNLAAEGLGGFDIYDQYWSSSEASADFAYYMDFDGSNSYEYVSKNGWNIKVRAARKF